MKVFIFTLGTRGDFELFLILAKELHRRGHHIILGASEFYSQRVRDGGMEWKQIGTSTRDEVVSILRSLAPVKDQAARTYAFYKKWLQPQLAASIKDVTSIGAESDYFISNLKMVLQRNGQVIPGAAVTYDPPGSLNDLPKYGTQLHNGRILDLVAMSKKLIDPEDRWGAPFRFTGFWADQHPPSWKPAAGLLKFLQEGPPPVVMTMGSMVMFDLQKLVRDFGESLRLTEQRGIIVSGWSGLSESGVPGLFCTGEVSYDWLFSRASCIIHHGGCGTVAAVLRSGNPSVVLPQVTCQGHFGRLLARAGLAAAVLDVHTLKAGDLARAIHKAVTDEQVRQTARQWQKTISEEGGVQAAADSIEAHGNELR